MGISLRDIDIIDHYLDLWKGDFSFPDLKFALLESIKPVEFRDLSKMIGSETVANFTKVIPSVPTRRAKSAKELHQTVHLRSLIISHYLLHKNVR